MRKFFVRLMSCAAIGIAVSADALNIVPTFDSSIVNDPNGPAMMTAITAAIQDVQSHYADTVTVSILFTNDTSISLGQSLTWGGSCSYPAYLTALKSKASGVFDNNAISRLPNSATDPVIGGTQIRLTSALGRLMGFNVGTFPAGYDSIISLNMPKMNFTRPPGNPSKYDLQQVVEHEIDEVLGCSSDLPNFTIICPIDLFRYTTNLARTYTTNGDNAYFSVDGINLLARFNMDTNGDYSDFWSYYGSSRWSPPGTTPHPQVQDAFNTPGVVLDYGINELAMLDVIGWTLADINPPTVTMDSPTPSGAYNFVPIASGRAWDTNGIGNSGVQEVQVVLSRTADGFWWNFRSNTWGNAVFNAFYNIQIASGTASWTATLPSSLADGGYQVQARAVDLAGNTSDWLNHHFTIDSTPPTVTINSPTNTSYKVAPPASGTAADNNGIADTGVAEVRVVLYRTSDAVWWNFHDNTWGTTNFNAFYNLRVATGTTSWSAALPASLADGGYRVQALAVDGAANDSGWVPRDFTIDNTAPIVTFSPLTNQQTVFNFDQLGGTVSKTSTVQFKIEWFRTGGNLFWNGGNWISVANDPSVLLPASLSGLNWTPAPGTLPPRLQLARANYLIHAFVTDAAGNTNYNNIVLARSAPDTTPPLITSDNIHSGDVITNHFLPAISGLAYDPESGVASVNVLLTQITVSGSLYWDGANWNPTPMNLTATYLATNASWHLNVALPSGANLPNATYFLDVSAMNNEVPAGSGSLNLSFSVDYHPIFVFTFGSNPGPNPNMSWSDPANWDVGSVPTPDARVVITNYSPDNTILGSLQLYRLDLSGGSLTTSGMLITKLNVSGGVLSGGTIGLPANGVFNWSGGILTGIYNVPAGATVNLTGSADKTLSLAKLTNNGAVNWNGGNVLASYGSVIHNHATFVIQSSGFFSDNNGFYGYGYPLPLFVNNGLLQKTNSNGVTTFAPDNGGWTFNQNGTIDVENGALSSQGQFNVDGGAIFAGPGETRVDAGTVVMNGTNTIQPGATVELAGGSWNGNNVFTGPGTFVWSAGTIVGTNTIGVGANLSISGAGAKTLTGKLASAGNAAWVGAGAINCSFGSVFENDGTFTVQNDSVFYNNNVFYGYGYPLPVFVNNGSWVKTNSPNTTFFHTDNGGVAFNNNGSVTVRSGNLALGGGGTSQNANFNIASGSEVDLTGGTHNFGSGLNFNGGLTRMISGTLNFSGTNVLTNSAAFEIAGGNVTGTNTFAGAGTVNWSGGTISARLGLQSNIVFNITGAGDKTLSLGTINSSGPGTWTGAGRVNASFGSVFENDGTFTVQNDSVFYNNNVFYGYGPPPPVFINNGSWTKTNSPNTTFFHTDNGGVAFNNNGSVTVRSGNLALGGGGVGNNGSFAGASGSHIDFLAGNFSLTGNLSFAGAGSTRVNGGTLTFGNSASTMVAGGTFEVLNGSAGGTNTFAGTGNFNWSGGTISGTISLQPNIALDITGDGPKTLTGKLASAGNGVWTGAGAINFSYGGLFENDGTFTVQNDSVFYNNNGFYGYGPPPPVFVNTGTFRKTGSTNATVFANANGGVNFNNTGTVDLRSGTLGIDAGYTTSSANQLDISIGGLNAGTQFGNEDFTGAATFAGTLGISLTNGFTPTNGNSFVIATYSSHTGQFTSTQFPPLPKELKWQLTYNVNSLLLQVVPANLFQNLSLTNNGNFQFTFVGETGSSCLIEASTNLFNWAPLLTNAPFNGLLNYVDPQTPQFPKRFYRATIYP